MASSDYKTAGAEYAGKAADAAHKAGMPQLDFSNWPSQIFWTAIAVSLMYWLLSRKVLPRIAGSIEDRHSAISNDLDRAAELKAQAEKAQADYDSALSDARGRANDIAEKTRSDIASQIESENAHAEAQIAARSAEGDQRIEQVRTEAVASAKSIATDTAAQILDKLAPGLGDKSRIGAAVDRALQAKTGA